MSILVQYRSGENLNIILYYTAAYPLYMHQLLKATVKVSCAFSNVGAKLWYPLKDKISIVMGGNTGIGYETAKALAIMVAHDHMIIACRSMEKEQQVQ